MNLFLNYLINVNYNITQIFNQNKKNKSHQNTNITLHINKILLFKDYFLYFHVLTHFNVENLDGHRCCKKAHKLIGKIKNSD